MLTSSRFFLIILIFVIIICQLWWNVKVNKLWFTNVIATSIVEMQDYAVQIDGLGNRRKNKNKKKKPILYLHIGPHKTATTTLQKELTRYGRLLMRNSIKFFGRKGGQRFQKELNYVEPGYRVLPSNETNNVRTLTVALREQKALGNDVVFSDEYLSEDLTVRSDSRFYLVGIENLTYLARLSNEWDVRILMGYRPWFELVASRHNQIFKPSKAKKRSRLWPDQGGTVVLPMERFWNDEQRYVKWWNNDWGAQQWNNPAHVKRIFSEFFDDVRIFDVHEGDVVENFLCDLLERATAACDRYRSGRKVSVFHNAAVPVCYDMIATAASTKDYFDRNLSRPEVVEMVRYRHENQLNLTVDDLPVVCPPTERVRALHDASVEIEKELFPSRGNNHTRLEESFSRALEQKKFCHVNTTEILADEGWDAFFRNISSR